MTHPLLVAIWAPILAGLVLWMVPRAAAVVVKALAALVALFTAAWVVLVWAAPEVLTGGEALGKVMGLTEEQIANAIIDLVSCENRRCEMAQKAREMVVQIYDSERVARLMIQAFEDILSGSCSPECRWV